MTTPKERSPIVCQYWIEDEPSQCIHWDNSNTYCKFVEEVTDRDGEVTFRHAELFPTCNNIGTGKYRCKDYVGTGEEGRCVLPDPYRSTPRSELCSWVAVSGTLNTTSSGTAELETSSFPLIDYKYINNYNDGKCDYKTTPGASPTCVAFSPGHLGFGRRPQFCEITDKNEVIDVDGSVNKRSDDTAVSGIGIPLGYGFLNARAKLGKCYYWPTEDIEYYVDSEGIVQGPSFQCTSTDVKLTTSPTGYNDFKVDEVLEAIIPPCNGAKPDCLGYTGNLVAQSHPNANTKFPYLSDKYFRCGDKISAEQILELQYNIKKEKWKKKDFEERFSTTHTIYAFEGERPEVQKENDVIVDYKIKVAKTYIDDFDCLFIKSVDNILTKGNQSDASAPDYPTLVEGLKALKLSPVIRNYFDDPDDSDSKHILEVTVDDHKYAYLVGDCFNENNTVFAINTSDPDLNFINMPFAALFIYETIYDIEKELSNETFIEFKVKLKNYINFLINNASHKIFGNEFTINSRSFGINVETFFGENKIIVFDY